MPIKSSDAMSLILILDIPYNYTFCYFHGVEPLLPAAVEKELCMEALVPALPGPALLVTPVLLVKARLLVVDLLLARELGSPAQS